MKPKRIILIRHGESEGNIDKAMYNQKPDYALLLTEKGKQQAAAAGSALKELVKDEKLCFYVSPLFRTRQTFQQITKAFPKDNYYYREEPRLREQEWGHLRSLEECNEVEKQRDAYGTFYFRIPDGESAADVYDRVSDFFNTFYRDIKKEEFPPNAVMVTHGMSIRLFLMRWFHFTVEDFEQIANPANCAMVVMELQENGKYKLVEPLKKHEVAHGWRLVDE
ncbi:MAG: histidine phosphatase family protein [Ferruginibacter sp.]